VWVVLGVREVVPAGDDIAAADDHAADGNTAGGECGIGEAEHRAHLALVLSAGLRREVGARPAYIKRKVTPRSQKVIRQSYDSRGLSKP
jgi:hypothetical protein